MFALLQLQGAYDSNNFAERIYEISAQLREQPASKISQIFESHLIDELAERRSQNFDTAFSYSLFKPMSIDRLNTRFTRYFFGRIERFLAEGIRLQMKHSLYDLVMSRGRNSGFQIEHILSRNDDNKLLFDNDEERFEQERNRLGGVLLMKGKDNISSGNETFQEKLKSYANTLYWNETLREDSYKSKLDFRTFANSSKLDFRSLSSFGPEELEQRHYLLFQMCERIWPVPNVSPR